MRLFKNTITKKEKKKLVRTDETLRRGDDAFCLVSELVVKAGARGATTARTAKSKNKRLIISKLIQTLQI